MRFDRYSSVIGIYSKKSNVKVCHRLQEYLRNVFSVGSEHKIDNNFNVFSEISFNKY